jgi:hypothetical protein
MPIAIEITQVRCAAVTHPKTSADEVYLAYALGVATSGAKTKAAFVGGKVSKVKNDVKKDMVWVPDGGMKATIDPGKAKLLFLMLGVFEKDDGKFRKKLVESIGEILTPPKFAWKEVEIPGNVTDPTAWIKAAWKFLGLVWRRIVEDDHLGTLEIPIDLTTDGWEGSREIKFRRLGAEYRVSLRLKEV